jgi:hypothetical protein
MGGGCSGNGCDQARKAGAQLIRKRVQRVTVTPEWKAENAAKQAAYAQRRRAWVAQREEAFGRNEEQNSSATEQASQASQSTETNASAGLLALVFKNASTCF